MTVLSEIGKNGHKQLITAIIGAGLGKSLVQKYCEQPGILSISHHHARGQGSSDPTMRKNFQEQDVVIVLVEAEFTDAIFQSLFWDGKIGEPGGGLIFCEEILRGHPMMPLTGADW